MTEIACESLQPLARTRHWLNACLADPRRRFMLGGAFAGLVLLCALGALSQLDGEDRNGAATADALDRLPGRPEDIERHGKASQTTLAEVDARSRNARVAIDPRSDGIAMPFIFRGSETDRARATGCLATAVLYEAGDDRVGQAAVAQVVLNRVRHPAFPGTVCGVVYQGSQRRTGCQFTFTCDGSLRRTMSDAAWRRARSVASAALAGQVDHAVGLATHYHTDWVYPYWSPSLRKLAKVGTHLFFGWPGGWGALGAFGKVYRGNEQEAGAGLAETLGESVDDNAAVAADGGEAGILGLPQAPARLPDGMGAVPLYGNKVKLVRPDGRAFGLLSPPGASATQVVNAALALCGKPGPCRVNAWSNEDDIPGSYPIPSLTRATMVFEYVREGGGAGARIRFDCSRFPNKDPRACLAHAGEAAPDVLAGVRFK